MLMFGLMLIVPIVRAEFSNDASKDAPTGPPIVNVVMPALDA